MQNNVLTAGALPAGSCCKAGIQPSGMLISRGDEQFPDIDIQRECHIAQKLQSGLEFVVADPGNAVRGDANPDRQFLMRDILFGQYSLDPVDFKLFHFFAAV